jgi:hypothetical protein
LMSSCLLLSASMSGIADPTFLLAPTQKINLRCDDVILSWYTFTNVTRRSNRCGNCDRALRRIAPGHLHLTPATRIPPTSYMYLHPQLDHLAHPCVSCRFLRSILGDSCCTCGPEMIRIMAGQYENEGIPAAKIPGKRQNNSLFIRHDRMRWAAHLVGHGLCICVPYMGLKLHQSRARRLMLRKDPLFRALYNGPLDWKGVAT